MSSITRGTQGSVLKAGVGAAVSSGTSEVALASVTIPGNLMGANGQLRIKALWTYTNSANNKVLRCRMGAALAGTVMGSTTATTTAMASWELIINNAGAANSQKVYSNVTAPEGTTTASPTTAAIDTTAAFDITLSGQPANAGETITLERYSVEFIPAV